MDINPAYSIRDLIHAYDEKVILDVPCLDIPAGRISLFTGPNGSGKTTLLTILALLQSPSGGAFRLNGIECRPDPDRELRRMVTLVHQNPVLFSTSVRNNLAYGLKAHGYNSGEIGRRIKWIEKEMQLSPLIEKHARKLSGGETQRIVLARALVLETPVLLLDEPTNSLDDSYRPVLVDLIQKANRVRKTTVIVATHDKHFIASLGGEILRMENGRILH
jgi:tungstate transport system ATP-binding protein